MTDSFEKISSFLLKFLQDEDDNKITSYANEISSSDYPPDQVISVYQTYLNLSKNPSIFGENASESLISLGKELESTHPEFQPYIRLLCSEPDSTSILSQKMPPLLSDELSQLRSASQSIIRYTTFKENPVGFSRFLISIFISEPEEVLSIIGEHSLNPFTVLNIILDVVEQTNNLKVAELLKLYPFQSVCQVLFHRVSSTNSALISKFMSIFYNLGSIPDDQIFSFYSSFETAFISYRNFLKNSTDNYVKELTQLVSCPQNAQKSQFLTSAFKIAKSKYENSWATLKDFVPLNYVYKCDDKLFLHGIQVLAQYEPCTLR